ncbi:hypothetical protein F1D05_36535 [Kribbella qitaiheensis]|uniref:Uncharacterized protein n=1 Tax=Kribbella qitaiheensis TaxID=1544730 RepID=A0A7G6X838_9ACTN|nr:hypothetical protein F1D05_36535 [Kribbella qitaiheensis]
MPMIQQSEAAAAEGVGAEVLDHLGRYAVGCVRVGEQAESEGRVGDDLVGAVGHPADGATHDVHRRLGVALRGREAEERCGLTAAICV